MSLVFKLTCFLLEISQDINAVRIGLLLIFSQATYRITFRYIMKWVIQHWLQIRGGHDPRDLKQL